MGRLGTAEGGGGCESCSSHRRAPTDRILPHHSRPPPAAFGNISVASGTSGSNPASSSAESGTNSVIGSAQRSRADVRLLCSISPLALAQEALPDRQVITPTATPGATFSLNGSCPNSPDVVVFLQDVLIGVVRQQRRRHDPYNGTAEDVKTQLASSKRRRRTLLVCVRRQISVKQPDQPEGCDDPVGTTLAHTGARFRD